MLSSSEIRQQAREALSGRWTSPVLGTLLFMILCGVASGIINAFLWNKGEVAGLGTIATWLITLPLTWGYYVMLLKFFRTREEVRMEELFACLT